VALYAAYGSNMDPAQMSLRCPHSPQRGTGWLEGWRLTFGGEELGWDGALTTLVEDAAQRVFVALYDVPEVDEKELDSWDGVNLGFYSKIKVRVQVLDGDVLAWLYVLDAYEGGLPSDRRLSILARYPVSLARILGGEELLCEVFDRSLAVSRFLLDAAPGWLDG